MLKPLYIVLGTFFLILGGIGLAVPVLPTTPFWLLSCWLYARGSRRIYERIINNKLIGSYVNDYLEHRSMRLKAKIVAISTVWISCIISCCWLIDLFSVKIFLIIVAVGVTIHLSLIPLRK